MSGLVHNFATRKWKRDVGLEQAVDATPKVVGGSGQPCPDRGSEVQTIVISGSPQIGLNNQPGW